MIIKKLELLNFRQFKKTEIEFAQDENKNVTIIMGENGAGKTTLAQSIQWCLYGETDFGVKEVINREVRENITDKDVIVSVVLTVYYDGRDYIIKRKQVFSKKGGKIIQKQSEQTISYKKTNGDSEFLDTNRARYLIKQMLSKELSGFFFFDGERIDKMSKEISEGKSKEFEDAVNGLMGLTATRNALKHLKSRESYNTVVGRFIKELSKNSKSIEESERIQKEINECLGQRNQVENRLEEIEKAIDKYEKRENELRSLVLDEQENIKNKERYNKLKKDVEKLEKDKWFYTGKNLLPIIDNGGYSFVAMTMIKKVMPELSNVESFDKSIPKLSRETLLHLLENGECLCGCKLKVGSDEFDRVNHYLDLVPPKSISTQADEIKKKSSDINNNGERFFDRIKSGMQTFRNYDEQIESMNLEAEDLFEKMVDISKAEAAQKEIKEIKNALINLRKEQGAKEDKRDNLTKSIGMKKNKLDNLVIVNSDTRKLMLYKAYAERIYDDWSLSYKKSEEETRITLETRINEIFKDIYDGNITIALDDKYNINVTSVDSMKLTDALERNTAQNYAIIFAFITAIIDVAKSKSIEAKKNMNEDSVYIETDGYPLIMDAALSSFDSTRIKNICNAMPSIAKQVILFIKDVDGTIAEQHMSEVIGERYELQKINNMHSVIERR